jgi:tRNA dimethylallyltransferase
VSAPAPVVVALFGPTAVGKTDVAVALAERLRASGERPVAVSADALQLYAGLELLTGAATPAQRARSSTGFSASSPSRRPRAPGATRPWPMQRSTGCSRTAASRSSWAGPACTCAPPSRTSSCGRPPCPEVRERRLDQLERRGAAALHDELRERAPEAAGRISTGDGHRIVRALELLDAGSRPPGGGQLWTRETRHPTLLVGVTMDRELLRERIDQRVDAMVRAGVEAEVRRADAAGASPTARKALGFEELLRGDVAGLKRRTWAYARRQLTWMRKLPTSCSSMCRTPTPRPLPNRSRA